MPWHADLMRKAPGLVRRQKGARGKPKPESFLGFVQEKQGRAG